MKKHLLLGLPLLINCTHPQNKENTKMDTISINQKKDSTTYTKNNDSLNSKTIHLSDTLLEKIIKSEDDFHSIDIVIPVFIKEPFPKLNKRIEDYLMGKGNYSISALQVNNNTEFKKDENSFHGDYRIFIYSDKLLSMDLSRSYEYTYKDTLDETIVNKEGKEESLSLILDLKNQKEIRLSDLVTNEKKFREHIIKSGEDIEFEKEVFKDEALETPINAMNFRMYPDHMNIFFRTNAFIMKGFGVSLDYADIKDVLNVEYLNELGIDV